MAALVLYNYWRSSSSHRVRIALALNKLDYEYVAVDLRKDEQSSAPHKARSPTGYVPCLAVDGVCYVESVAIIEMLDERFGSRCPLYPRDAHGRARVRALVEIVNSGIQPMQNLSVLRRVSGDPEAQKRWVRHFIERGFESFESAMRMHQQREGIRGRFAYGDAPTAADAFLVPQALAARRWDVDLARFPRIAAAFDAAMQLEAFQRAAPERQPDAPKG